MESPSVPPSIPGPPLDLRIKPPSTLVSGLVFRLVFGPFFGAVSLELLFGKDLKGAFKSGVGTLVGFLGGVIIKLVISVVIIGIFLIKLF